MVRSPLCVCVYEPADRLLQQQHALPSRGQPAHPSVGSGVVGGDVDLDGLQDRSTDRLMYRCRTCHNVEPASNYCVFRNNLSSNAGETAGVTTDIGSDPTVSGSFFRRGRGGSVLIELAHSFPRRSRLVRSAVSRRACSSRASREPRTPRW